MGKIVVNVTDNETRMLKALIFDELKCNEMCFRLCVHIADEIDDVIERIRFNIEEMENVEEE